MSTSKYDKYETYVIDVFSGEPSSNEWLSLDEISNQIKAKDPKARQRSIQLALTRCVEKLHLLEQREEEELSYRRVRLHGKDQDKSDIYPVLKAELVSNSASSDEATLPTSAYDDDAGYDLYASQDAIVPAHGFVKVNTNLAVILPESPINIPGVSVYGRVAPRSGLAGKHGLNVGAGVIDLRYYGIIEVVILSHNNVDYHIKQGDKIAQLIITLILKPRIEQVTGIYEGNNASVVVSNNGRGTRGFGSSSNETVEPENIAVVAEEIVAAPIKTEEVTESELPLPSLENPLTVSE